MASTIEYLARRLATPPRQRRRWQDQLPRVWNTLRRWRERARQRYQLAGLSDGALKDVGLSRVDALRESEKHFWQK